MAISPRFATSTLRNIPGPSVPRIGRGARYPETPASWENLPTFRNARWAVHAPEGPLVALNATILPLTRHPAPAGARCGAKGTFVALNATMGPLGAPHHGSGLLEEFSALRVDHVGHHARQPGTVHQVRVVVDHPLRNAAGPRDHVLVVQQRQHLQRRLRARLRRT